MLEVKNIYKSFLSGSGEKRTILDDLKFSIKSGEKVAIVGPSGSGKTTLLNLIGTLDRPDSGEILIDDQPVFNKNEKELSAFRNQSIGFVFQLHHLLPQLSLLDNILVPILANKKKVDDDDLAHANQLIRSLGLDAVKQQKPGQLSGGECQRTAVARALINRPKLVLADEPTGALDHHSSSQLTDMIIQLNESQKTALLVVTHSIELAKKMDKIYQLTDGKLIQQ
ncbi:ABC transporter ATP-binding protein [Sunxiuqinia sp. A32]|uniref:ABC transporter ATP-binding protein n=1 Tax=Sunxiuqinia sp. A32 TaxID=3461496 RepID=UPI0040462774